MFMSMPAQRSGLFNTSSLNAAECTVPCFIRRFCIGHVRRTSERLERQTGHRRAELTLSTLAYPRTLSEHTSNLYQMGLTPNARQYRLCCAMPFDAKFCRE